MPATPLGKRGSLFVEAHSHTHWKEGNLFCRSNDYIFLLERGEFKVEEFSHILFQERWNLFLQI